MAENRSTSVAHFTLDGQLSLDVDLATPGAEEGDDNAREEHGRRDDNDGEELDEHRDGHVDEPVQIFGNGAVDFTNVSI